MANKFRYPTGVRPLLVAEAARRRRVETRFVSMLERTGFEEVLLPIIDYVEPYSMLLDRNTARQSYRFVDREGDLVAIRSDFTPMLARALAPALAPADLPLRVFYRGDVIRCEASRLGQNREIFQIGAEIIGDDSPEADVDILMLASSCLGTFGIRPLVVYGNASLSQKLLDAGRTAAAREAIRTTLSSKRTGEMARVRDEIDTAAYGLIARLGTGAATLDDVNAYAPTAPIAERLRRIEASLDGIENVDFVLQLDDIDDSAGYYTGLRFRVYGDDSRTRLAQGGRYDDLYERFGTPAAAIGFTVTIDDVVDDAASQPESDRDAAVAAGELPSEVAR